MKITICGSISVLDEMYEVKQELESLGHEVKLPGKYLRNRKGEQLDTKEFRKVKKHAGGGDDEVWDVINLAMHEHFKKVAWSDAILVCNVDKNGIKNYLGPNTLMEMGLALYLEKKIYLLNPIPEVAWKEEILGMQPDVLFGEINLIT